MSEEPSISFEKNAATRERANGVDAGLPATVRNACERSELVRSALARWFAASQRLGLSRLAGCAGALALSAEFDDTTRLEVCGSSAIPRGLPRQALLQILAQTLAEAPAGAALTELEQRGVLLATAADCSWITQELYLAPEVRSHCSLGAPGSAGRATDSLAETEAEAPWLSARLLGLVEDVAQLARDAGGERLLVVIRGAPGSGRDGLLTQLLNACDKAALVSSTADLGHAHRSLEPELSGSVAVWNARRSDPSPSDEEQATRWLSRSTTLAVAVLDRAQDAPEVPGRRLISIACDPVDGDEREQIWRGLLQRSSSEPAAADAAARLARRTRSGLGLAARAIAMVGPLPDDGAEIASAVELALDTLIRPSARRGVLVERPMVPFSRLVVSEAVGAALEQVVLLAELGSELLLSERRGVKALFAGPSGTGKTLAARALASHLKRPLYRIDLAAVVSKWVGETEKNLALALEAGEAAGAVLLFDEGDALLAKRGEVSRGSDRYANLEVSYLLQALEAHDGIAIVTTNQKQNIDGAFQRRFDLSIEFAPPTIEARGLLWRQELGPQGEGLTADFLQALAVPELSGGNIASAARLACAQAYHRGERAVTEDDVSRAVSGELRKLGSSVQASNWANWMKRHA